MDCALPNQQGHPFGCGILRLDPRLREIIYGYLGACSESGAVIIVTLNDRRSSQTLPSPRNCHGLLLSCRVIYDELSHLIYAKNSFVIKYRGKGSLDPLQKLRPRTYAFLTSLRIILAEGSCFQHIFESDGPMDIAPWPCCKRNSWDCNGSHCHDKSITALDPRLEEWNTACSYLASTIGVGTLDLALVCDVCPGPLTTSLQAARSVTTPILRLPRLKDCSIRLCEEPNNELQQLVNKTVLRARHMMPTPILPRTPNSLEDAPPPALSDGCGLVPLPTELRLRILQYTDLVTPWKEVWWSPQHQHFILGHTYCEDSEGMGLECPPYRHYGCQFYRCDCRPSLSDPGCFCRKMHSAMSSKPTAACKCWQVPQALFLVCKALYKDAQAVFYSENRFVVFDRYSDPPWKRDVEWDDSAGSDNREGYPYHRLGVSRFLRDTVPTDCLQHLRFLELVYPAWDAHVWPQEGQTVLQEWAETLAWALNHLNPSGLTIRMVAMDASDWEQPLSRIRMTREQGIQVMTGYMRLLQPLTRHTGLRRFYAQLVSPWRWNSSIETSPKATETLERMAKQRAEKLVMGDRYSPVRDGCEEPRESVWHHCYERNA